MTRDSTLDTDDLLRLLATRRRRVLLRALLARSDRTADVSALAAAVRKRCGPDHESMTPADIEIYLQHTDLPKLAAADIVAYDSQAGRVSYRGGDDLEVLLETLDARFE